MSFLDRIAECNNADLRRFVPFRVGRAQAGWVLPAFARRLKRFPEVFAVAARGVALAPLLARASAAARTRAVDAVLRRLAGEGVIAGWREERYPVHPVAGGPALFAMERAAVPAFGVRAHGVHMTGYVRRPGGIHVWVARRAKDKHTYPNMLDNTVAGGQPVGLGLRENLIKECGEEAGIPKALARQAVAVGTVSYAYDGKAEGGLKPDVQYCFDLELPANFTPRAVDGEIQAFYLWPVARVAQVVRDTRAFKFNCNLVLIDFFIRHGVIPPEHPEYHAICRGLRR